METERGSVIDNLTFVANGLFSYKIEEIREHLSALIDKLTDLGDPADSDKYMSLFRNIMNHLSWTQDGIEEFSNALSEEGGIENIIEESVNNKKLFDIIAPIIIYAKLNKEEIN